jgi:FkbM family methyltransferase
MDAAIDLVGATTRSLRPRGRHLAARLLNRYFSDRSRDYRDRWGYRHVADLADPSESLAFVGKPALPSELHRQIRPGDWVIDAGANVGVLTAELRHIVGPSGVVWAFEPLPRNVQRLERLRDVNRLTNIEIFPGALSARNGVAALGLPVDGNSAHPSLAKKRDVTGAIEVETWALDDIAPPAPDARVRFIKIDVEGHEPAMLEGAERTLRTMQPIVLCEFNDELLRDGGSSAGALLTTFERLGYRATRIYREGRPIARVAPGRSPWTLVPVDWMVVDLLLEPEPAAG